MLKRAACVFTLLLALMAIAAAQSAPLLKVGAASATIDPPDGTFLAGYDLNRRSSGVHDHLYAKAVVFDDGKTAVALLVLDAISLQYPTVQQIRLPMLCGLN